MIRDNAIGILPVDADVDLPDADRDVAGTPQMLGADPFGTRTLRRNGHVPDVDRVVSRADMVAEDAEGAGAPGVDAAALGANDEVAGANVEAEYTEAVVAVGRDRSSRQIQPDPARRPDAADHVAMRSRAGARHLGGGPDRDVAIAGGLPPNDDDGAVAVFLRRIEVGPVNVVVGIVAVEAYREAVG